MIFMDGLSDSNAGISIILLEFCDVNHGRHIQSLLVLFI